MKLTLLVILIGLLGHGSASAQNPRFDSMLGRVDPSSPIDRFASELPPQPGGDVEQHSCAGRTVNELGRSFPTMWQGIRQAPRAMVRPANLKWELPIAAATGILIASVDTNASRRVKSTSLIDASRTASNVGIGLELGAAGGTYVVGCASHREYARSTGFTALMAMGYAAAENGVLKLAFNREFPTTANAAGRFWHGGKSFPSGHSAVSWAFAAVIADRYPNNRWLKWSAYGVATGVSVLRFTAKRHFPSDILVGSTLGYVTGAYLASH